MSEVEKSSGRSGCVLRQDNVDSNQIESKLIALRGRMKALRRQCYDTVGEIEKVIEQLNQVGN